MIQKVTLTAPTSIVFSQKVLNSNFLSEFKFATGIFIKLVAGAYTNGRLKITDGFRDIIKYVPLDVLLMNRSKINAPFFYFPIFTEANNKKFDIIFEADTITTAVDLDFNFELTNENDKPLSIFNFQHENLTIPGANSSASERFVLDADFETVKGILLISSNAAFLDCYDVKVRKDDGAAIITQAGAYMFDNSKDLPTDNRFYEVDFEAKGKNIFIEISKVRAQAVADTLQVVFLLDKKY